MIIPISTFFIGLNGLIALVLSYLVVAERTKTKLWHGEERSNVINQPNYLENPNWWASWVETFIERKIVVKTTDDGILQRKVRAFGNFIEYVPMALLFAIALELMQSPSWLVWLLGSLLTLGRIAHAWGLITVYGPSPARAIGFFLTSFVYLLGSIACVYSSIAAISSDISI